MAERENKSPAPPGPPPRNLANDRNNAEPETSQFPPQGPSGQPFPPPNFPFYNYPPGQQSPPGENGNPDSNTAPNGNGPGPVPYPPGMMYPYGYPQPPPGMSFTASLPILSSQLARRKAICLCPCLACHFLVPW